MMLLQTAVDAAARHPLSGTVAEFVWLLPVLPLAGFVINGLLFWLVGSFVNGFTVGGFWAGVFGAIVYSIISWALSSLLLKRRP